ncbi:MAG TPA: hypothetical protein PLK90_03280 [Clostridiales bacterium]|nr:hypothetical protein [Clostridiales bacterium]HQP69402.1 hypothetical protein [Clostridiales bacterium]
MNDVSTNIKPDNSSKIDIIGFLMVVTPLISSIILWYWFYHIKTMSITNAYILVIIASTVFLTSIFASIDSHRLGTTGRVLFQFFIFLFLWPYSYPVYLFRRKNFGGRNLLYPILFSMLIFIFSAGYLYYSLEMKNINENSIYRRKLYQNITR